MTDKTNDIKLCLSRKKTPPSDYALKVPNFFTLPEYDDILFQLDSPSFEFANATWRFRCESRPNEKSATGHWIKNFALYMIRLNYNVPEQRIFYTVILLNSDDEIYKHFSDNDVFCEDVSHTNLMWIFSNHEPCCDARDTLTLIIHLYDAKSAMKSDEEFIATDKGVEILLNDLKKLLMNGKHHDLTLKVADKEFLVHQDILMARSPVFEAMLNHDMTEKKEGVIDVPDCDPESMEEFLHYVYCGKVEDWNTDIALGLYYLADKYNMMLLKEKCTEFIKKSLSITVICDVIQLALNHSDSDLLERATEYFLNHVGHILPTVGWMSFLNSNSIAANELLIKTSKKWDCAKS